MTTETILILIGATIFMFSVLFNLLMVSGRLDMMQIEISALRYEINHLWEAFDPEEYKNDSDSDE